MRVAGVNIPDAKRVDVSLTYIFGIGPNMVGEILEKAKIDPVTRTNKLSDEEVLRLQKVLETYKIEGDLRADRISNIKRLRDINAYRGVRHTRNLPVRGQRTRSNGRTKRGKRVTIGAIRKDVAEKMAASK